MIHIYEIPEKLSNGFCMQGAVPIVFGNVDWLQGDGIDNDEELVAFIKNKQYIRKDRRYLILKDDSAIIIPKQD